MIFKAILSDNVRKDGGRNILIYVYSNGEKHRFKTEFYVRPSEFFKGKVRNKLNADYINGCLTLKIAELEKNWLQDRSKGVKDVGKGKDTLTMFMDYYLKGIESGEILNEGKKFAKSSIKGLKNDVVLLKKFIGNNSWDGITRTFFDSFVSGMRERGYKENTIARAIKALKVIMKKGSKHHSNNEYLTFKMPYQDVDTIALNDSEIEKIKNCRLPKHLQGERDRFYLSYNLLLRYGDSIKIDKRDISKKNGKWIVSVTHEKTGNKGVIPLFPQAYELLKKYDFNLSKTTNQESNWKLKEIGRIAKITGQVTIEYIKGGVKIKESHPKYKLITTHTARRSMATNLYLEGFDLKEIQLMGGWRSMAVLEKYLKVDKLKNALNASKHPFFN